MLRVLRSDDAGDTWRAQGAGLPDDFYAAVLRDAAHAVPHAVPHGDDAALAFGTRNSRVFVSLDGGESFTEVASNLPDVLSLRLWAE